MAIAVPLTVLTCFNAFGKDPAGTLTASNPTFTIVCVTLRFAVVAGVPTLIGRLAPVMEETGPVNTGNGSCT